jgi:glycosyltransferase involved in cell wall biosynthesis
MKVAFIGNIYSRCGIATYNENLLEVLKNHCEISFFAERNGRNEDTDVVKYCWDREEFPKTTLIDKVDEFKPDVVLFSHEYGIFPKSYYFSTLVSYFKLKGYKVVTIFHSVYAKHQDKLTSESVCKNVVVHTNEAKSALYLKGVNLQNINVIPHGCSFSKNGEEILPNLWNHFGNKHVILQTGFLFYYKNHLEMLDIVAELKNKYSDILYIIIASENPKCQAEHDKLYKEISEKITNLRLDHNVIIDRGFASDEVLMSYIRTSSVCVLPYRPDPEFDVFAASGMARIVLQTVTPLITSNANLFNGLDSVVKKAATKEEWVKEISDIFEKKLDQKDLVAKRKKFIQENSWDKSAAKLVELFNKAK